MSFLKSKALFMIIVLLIALFTISNLQPVDARQNACCEKTTAGQYCQYTALKSCDTAYQTSPTKCEQTSFCQPVCCITPQDGLCYTQTGASQCAMNGGVVDAQNPNCNTQQCAKGCCTIGNSYFLTTETACKIQVKQYPNLDPNSVFDSSVTDEQTCVDKGRQQDQGCCVSGQSCIFTSRGQCQGTFNHNVFCSDATLSCGCKAQSKKVCIAGQDDVYWVDSCGNQESVAEDCDYSQGTLCQENNGAAFCKSVDCAATVAIPNNVHDPKIGVGSSRKNGEAWCSYESPAGDWLDRPGSRHYRHVCVNGQELVSECRQFREDVCVQVIAANGISTANCIPQIENSLLNSNITTVPQGQKFWDGSNKDQCNTGTVSCTVIWAKKNNLDDWDCEANCACERLDHVDTVAKSRVCQSRGDCGADMNVLGKQTTGGLQVTWTGNSRGARPTQVTSEFWNNISVLGVFGGLLGVQRIINDTLASSVSGVETASMQPALLGLAMAYLVLAVVTTYAVLSGATSGILLALAAGGAAVPVVGWILAALAIIVAILLGGGKTATKTVTVACEPWTAPTGGDDCSKCGDDARYQTSNYAYPVTCDEYRCKSLGTACELVNEGTLQSACIDVYPNDVTHPTITPWPEVLPNGYTSQPTPQGYLIQPDVPAFTPLRFGIHTDEMAKCKLETNHTNSFDEMMSSFGTSIYALDHNITLLLPGGSDYTYYTRCQDKKGNSNIAEYTIQFRTQQEPDLQPPLIEGTNPVDGTFIAANANQTQFTLFLNEPADTCQWSTQDQDIATMPAQNVFLCDSLTPQPTTLVSYTCIGLLTGIQQNTDNTFYSRCRDLAGNEQQQSTRVTLKGSLPLTISSAEPSGELFTSSPQLQVVTAGGAEQGKSKCTYQTGGYSAVQFLSTDSATHTQPLQDLQSGSYTYTIQCADVAGNTASQSSTFTISVDTDAPTILNLYSDGAALYLSTDESATCSYSSTASSFSFDQGRIMGGAGSNKHTLSLQEKKYYIQCRDQFQNTFAPITVYV